MNFNISDLVAAVSTVIAAIAAIFSFKAARATEKVGEAQLIRDFAKVYAGDEFRDDLKTLRLWDSRSKAEKLDFILLVRGGDKFAVRVDQSRRRVFLFFDSIARLGYLGYIGRGAVRSICGLAGINLFFDVAVPLTLLSQPTMSMSHIRYLSRLKLQKAPLLDLVSDAFAQTWFSRD